MTETEPTGAARWCPGCSHFGRTAEQNGRTFCPNCGAIINHEHLWVDYTTYEDMPNTIEVCVTCNRRQITVNDCHDTD